MTMIIIGAGGFLGSNLRKHYSSDGQRVVCISFRPDNRETFLAKFTAALIQEKPSVVINAGASQTGGDDSAALTELINSNIYLPAVLGSLILVHAPNTRLINFGTSWQIGDNGESLPFNAYAASKAASEPFFDHFAQSGLKVATLRLYDTYGPGDMRKKIVNLIADALISQSELPMSSGEQIIDLVHIDDVISAVDATLGLLDRAERGIHHVYSVRSGMPVRILDVLAMLKQAAGIDNTDFIKLGTYAYRKRERFVLFSNTPAPPNWKPKVLLYEGLRAVFETRRLIGVQQ